MKGIAGLFGFLGGFMSLLILGRVKGKVKSAGPGEDVNHPTFSSRKDFLGSFSRVMKIYTKRKLDGKTVLRPWKDNHGWLDPAFREKLCLVVTINNHCVG